MVRGQEDRRVRRTRELLREALVALILEKGYEATTVQNILDRADVGRSTFYAHYHDKDDLLLSGLEHFRGALEAHEREEDQMDVSLTLFRHAAEYHRLYKAMVGKRGGNVFLEHMHAYLFAHLRKRLEGVEGRTRRASVPIDVATQHLVGSLLALLTWWLDRDLPYSPEKMDAIFKELVTPGLEAALGK